MKVNQSAAIFCIEFLTASRLLSSEMTNPRLMVFSGPVRELQSTVIVAARTEGGMAAKIVMHSDRQTV